MQTIELQTLDLTSNQIQDISFLQGLQNLTSLDLSGNQIQDISLDLLNNFPQLEKLKLNNNPIQNIPQEIFREHDCLKEVRHYLEDAAKGKAKNREVKVILIGNGSVGKTQIAKRMVEQENYIFDEQHNSTQSIVLMQRQLNRLVQLSFLIKFDIFDENSIIRLRFLC